MDHWRGRFYRQQLRAQIIEEGNNVFVFDNLSRKGAEANLDWIGEDWDFFFKKGDVRDFEAVKKEIDSVKPDVIVHLAAQVAVTTSVDDPRTDFDINAQGTFNVLEAARLSGRKPQILYASTNKVYGGFGRSGDRGRTDALQHQQIPAWY